MCESNPHDNVYSTTYKATDGILGEGSTCKALPTAGERQVARGATSRHVFGYAHVNDSTHPHKIIRDGCGQVSRIGCPRGHSRKQYPAEWAYNTAQIRRLPDTHFSQKCDSEANQSARAFCSGHRRRTMAIQRLPVLETPRKLTKQRGSPSGTQPTDEGVRLCHFCLLSPLTWVEQRCAQPRPELCFLVASRVRTP